MRYLPAFPTAEEDWEVYKALLATAQSFTKDGSIPANEAASVRGAVLFALTTLNTAIGFTLAGVPLVEAVE
jgi:hypothetical protein